MLGVINTTMPSCIDTTTPNSPCNRRYSTQGRVSRLGLHAPNVT
jgi:hypothetical protein